MAIEIVCVILISHHVCGASFVTCGVTYVPQTLPSPPKGTPLPSSRKINIGYKKPLLLLVSAARWFQKKPKLVFFFSLDARNFFLYK